MDTETESPEKGHLWTMRQTIDTPKGTVSFRFNSPVTIEHWTAMACHLDERTAGANVCQRILLRTATEKRPQILQDCVGLVVAQGDELHFDLREKGASKVGVILLAREPAQEPERSTFIHIFTTDEQRFTVELTERLGLCDATDLGIMLASVVRKAAETFDWDAERIAESIADELGIADGESISDELHIDGAALPAEREH